MALTDRHRPRPRSRSRSRDRYRTGYPPTRTRVPSVRPLSVVSNIDRMLVSRGFLNGRTDAHADGRRRTPTVRHAAHTRANRDSNIARTEKTKVDPVPVLPCATTHTEMNSLNSYASGAVPVRVSTAASGAGAPFPPLAACAARARARRPHAPPPRPSPWPPSRGRIWGRACA